MIYRKPKKEDAANMLQYLKRIGGESDNLTFGSEGLPFTIKQEEEYLDKLAASCIIAVEDDGTIVGDGSLELGVRRISHSAELGISDDELTSWQSQLKVTNIVSLSSPNHI